jgi:hypothetical protein
LVEDVGLCRDIKGKVGIEGGAAAGGGGEINVCDFRKGVELRADALGSVCGLEGEGLVLRSVTLRETELIETAAVWLVKPRPEVVKSMTEKAAADPAAVPAMEREEEPLRVVEGSTTVAEAVLVVTMAAEAERGRSAARASAAAERRGSDRELSNIIEFLTDSTWRAELDRPRLMRLGPRQEARATSG